ncbi:MAG: ACT domain-containing protein [Hydrococcus sp. CRU_1_1]|nr:ACT domain-containing protein [Hydrococcus sp. CRU_1_1]
MNGETDLATLLKNMQPSCDRRMFVFCSIDETRYKQLKIVPMGIFRETEGITIIASQEDADLEALPYSDIWALITLTVHSSLTAVGFLAAITQKLAAAGISVNAISAYYHDHLFIPWNDRDRALNLLMDLRN